MHAMRTTPDTEAKPSLNSVALKKRLNSLIKGQVIKEVAVLNETEFVIFFESGDRLFVNSAKGLDVSVT